MVTAELIAQKIQQLLGNKYKVRVNHMFSEKYYNEVTTPFGKQLDVNWQAFEKDNDVIPVCVSVTPGQLYATPYRYDEGRYSISFWVPVNYIKPGESPKFDFFGDFYKLQNAFKAVIVFTDGDASLRGFFTVSEPQVVNGNKDEAGTYTRITYEVSGSFTIADAGLGMGSDIAVGIEIDSAESLFENIYSFASSASTDANAILDHGDIGIKQDAAQTQLQIVFSVDDYGDSPAMQLVRDKAFANIETLTPGATEKGNKLKVKTNVYKRGDKIHSFWGVLSAEYAVADKPAFGSYRVTISDDGGSGSG